METSAHLGKIVSDGTANLTWKASVGKVGEADTGAPSYAKDAGWRLWVRVRSQRFGHQTEVG